MSNPQYDDLRARTRAAVIKHYADMIRDVVAGKTANSVVYGDEPARSNVIFGEPVNMSNPDEVLVCAVYHPDLQLGRLLIKQEA